MFGSLLSTAFKIATLPVDVASIGVDVVTGGDGSKKSRTKDSIIGDVEGVRDAVADAIESVDY